MTSSDATRLDPGVLAELATRGGRVIQGSPGEAGAGGEAGEAARVALACSRFNGGITTRLLSGALDALDHYGVPAQSVTIAWVPGAFELPLVASRLARSGEHDAVVCLGAVIRGDTAHFEYVAGRCASGISRVALDTGVPVIFGVLTTEDVDQALARSTGGESNKGYEAAAGALEMVDLLRRMGE
ncbi:MAG: 6,7-dimethyl-8-ribityllumazine synthase [Actinomycetota bacterium]|jgi:6,7-dimethyl-8-ribityllumazine synthase|nr:6,7-dimethyl-8-ribityllumazine synthase [Actinomycetota bacterium]